MSWLNKILPAIKTRMSMDKKGVKEGVWDKCPNCNEALYQPELVKNKHVCVHCSHHIRIGARRRISYFLDESW